MFNILRKTASGIGYCIKTKRIDFIALVLMAFTVPIIAATTIQLFMGVDLSMSAYAHPYILTVSSFYLLMALLKSLQIQYKEVEKNEEMVDFISHDGCNILCGLMLSVLLFNAFLNYNANAIVLFFAVLVLSYQVFKAGKLYLMIQKSNLRAM